uniref:Molybdate transport system substrate-binding protein n=1 Tax=Candidatus Kentrum sp. FM TaxID=2126340 RepID=A0A450SU43_9GAMM|nr:MAG: molybdate transport system substrate-binding protein [Candidatus Kentron sp. FM]VFJ72381.1 MAG: molybdate transport system substrate-binding protein [Candidatus Kentron sp. FM]VFK19819.1 MAG: molybdate transport system substrate-binding protein [Candidatus Kentron sp. FM]
MFTCWALLSGQVFAQTVHVAVASNFADTLRLLTKAYPESPPPEFKISAASTGKLFAQIHHGAPFHLFLAADARRPALLVKSGDAVAETLFTYAMGRLVLWRPIATGGTQQALSHHTLTGPIHRLAMANPKTAPYGRAAEETLRALGLWEKLQPKLVRGENIGQTYQFVATGAAEMGFVAWSQILWRIRSGRTPGEERAGQRWIVPSSLHAPLIQQAVLLQAGADNPAARRFLAFLQSPGARELIRAQGYELP